MIYLDNAATTPVHPDVLQALVPYFVKNYGNPSGIYDIARTNKEAIENARKIIADSLNASPDEIYFTSGGTEADNWVLTRAVEKNKSKKRKILDTYGINLTEKAKNDRILTAMQRQEILSDIARNEENFPNDRIKSIDVLNKMTGEYLQKVSITKEEEIPKLLDALKDEQY